MNKDKEKALKLLRELGKEIQELKELLFLQGDLIEERKTEVIKLMEELITEEEKENGSND